MVILGNQWLFISRICFFFFYLAWRNPGLVKGKKKIANLSFSFFNVVKVEGAKRGGKKGISTHGEIIS